MRPYVALRKESVDRNLLMWYQCNTVVKSLSARRAWIEIGITMVGPGMMTVALRKESVDRNPPSAASTIYGGVALRKESVDRNKASKTGGTGQTRRSPQGERG